MTEQQQRAAVVAEAKSWLNTPFVDCARVKGVGIDCAQFIAGVYEQVLGTPIHIDTYSPQWLLHHGEELFIAGLSRYCREIEERDVQPGDIVLYRVGRCYSHGAIVLDWPRLIIHAVKQQRGVVYSDPVRDKFVACRQRRFFTFFHGAN